MSRLVRTHLALEEDRDRLEKEAIKARGKISFKLPDFVDFLPLSKTMLIDLLYCDTQKLRRGSCRRRMTPRRKLER